MKRLNLRLRHLPFYETLKSADASGELWHLTAACLHTLRLVDAWRRKPRRRTSISSRHIRAVRHYVQMVEGEARQRLSRALEAVESNEGDAETVVGRALLGHAAVLHLQMDWRHAIDVCETIVARLGRHVPSGLLLESVMRWGASARASGRLHEARRVYVKLLKLARRHHSTEHVLRSGIGIANVLMERGNYPRAESMIDAIITRARPEAEAGRPSALWRALHTRAAIAMNRGRYSEGIADAYEALGLCDDLPERESMLHDIAVAFSSLGHLSAAQDALLVLHTTAQNHSVRWSAAINLMEIAALEGRAESFESLRRELAGQRMRPWHHALFLQLAGEGYERLGQHDQALQMYELAISTGEALGTCEVVVRAEARSREVRAKRYLPARAAASPVSQDVEQVIEAVAGLRIAAGIPAGGEQP